MCNITKCCTEVCPEHIKITDNAIIPMKERVVDAALRPGGLARAQDLGALEEAGAAGRRGAGRGGSSAAPVAGTLSLTPRRRLLSPHPRRLA